MSAIYSIRDLEQLSGIKAHTIRIWEQRYGILQAGRTDTNIRFYDESELRHMLQLALLNRHGFKISKLAAMDQKELGEKVQELIDSPQAFSVQIEALVLATIAFDAEKCEKILHTAILQMGLEGAMLKVVLPFLEKLGMLWVAGNVIAAQEHFISQIIRQKLIVAIDGQSSKVQPDAKRFVLFLPNGEWHEINLLFLCFMLRARGQEVFYLGSSVPLQDVIQTGEIRMPDAYYTIITSPPSGYSEKDYLNTLADHFPKSTVYVSGARMQDVPRGLSGNVEVLRSREDVLAWVEGFLPISSTFV
ncbi:MAG: MerR family transcriptional regulator [Chitinophagales bacterium]